MKDISSLFSATREIGTTDTDRYDCDEVVVHALYLLEEYLVIRFAFPPLVITNIIAEATSLAKKKSPHVFHKAGPGVETFFYFTSKAFETIFDLANIVLSLLKKFAGVVPFGRAILDAIHSLNAEMANPVCQVARLIIDEITDQLTFFERFSYRLNNFYISVLQTLRRFR